jgi:NAD(P)-dependent dehydrogenase (short-subunit alcohol dehydrogenase family)
MTRDPYSRPGRYVNKVAVVTGAGAGIGRAIAEGLIAEGAFVVANDVRADALVALEHDRMVTVAGDVSLPETADRLVAAALSLDTGRIDALFNNAGIALYKPAVELSPDEWRRVINVNVEGSVLVATVVGRTMIEQGGGAILNTASTAGTAALPDNAPYVVTKHAVVGLTRALAIEWGPYGIRVNALCPGMTETEMNTGTRDKFPDYWVAREQLIPLRRAGQATEQAATALHLNSDEASYVSGLVALADGGAHALYSSATVRRPEFSTSRGDR